MYTNTIHPCELMFSKSWLIFYIQSYCILEKSQKGSLLLCIWHTEHVRHMCVKNASKFWKVNCKMVAKLLYLWRAQKTPQVLFHQTVLLQIRWWWLATVRNYYWWVTATPSCPVILLLTYFKDESHNRVRVHCIRKFCWVYKIYENNGMLLWPW